MNKPESKLQYMSNIFNRYLLILYITVNRHSSQTLSKANYIISHKSSLNKKNSFLLPLRPHWYKPFSQQQEQPQNMQIIGFVKIHILIVGHRKNREETQRFLESNEMTAPSARTSGIVEIALKRKFTAKRAHTKMLRNGM